MELSFVLLALLTLAGALAAMCLPNLVHCALSLALTFVGLAGLYWKLNAEFVGFVQVLVYVGAVAILIVFAILLTRYQPASTEAIFSRSWVAGAGMALLVGGALILSGAFNLAGKNQLTLGPSVTVRDIGQELMTQYVLPLEVIGLVLTVALIGAVLIAMPEKGGGSR